MNWTGMKHAEGFEFHLPATALALMVMVRGAGAWSFDRLLAGTRGAEAPRRLNPAMQH